ncbi:MAG: penicillin-binding protein 1B [Candidatus Dasytiphilus stammeri]
MLNKAILFTKKYKTNILLILISILLGISFIMYGVKLDTKIRHKINSKVWQLPMVVYGRIITLSKNISNKETIINILAHNQYRKVFKIALPGEFIINNNSIEIFRRPFRFPDNWEKEIHACLTFKNGILKSIRNIDNGYYLTKIRIDPILINMWKSPHGEQRFFIPRKNFPDLLVDILLTTEDSSFYYNSGISISAMGRALIANLIAGKTIQGGSTITQQLVRNLFLNNKRTLWRKLNEIYMALIINARYSKDRILELYLNNVYLGQRRGEQIHGFPLASIYYFGRPLDELTLEQQALLVGMVKGASLYNPWHQSKLALERRNIVLRILHKNHIIDHYLYEKFVKIPINIKSEMDFITAPPAFMQQLNRELNSQLQNKIHKLSGLKIFTTLDPWSELSAEEAVKKGIPFLRKKYHLPDLQTALVVVDRFSGEIRTLIGGASPQFAGYNRALYARRSIGSLVKPAIYLAALSYPNIYRLNTWINDKPIELEISSKQIWKPHNNDYSIGNHVMLLDGLVHSLNIPTVNLGLSIGINRVTEMLIRLGVPKDKITKVPSLLLGAINLTPIEVTQIYQTLANNGRKSPLSTLRYVLDEKDTLLYQKISQSESVVSRQADYLILYAMQQIVMRGTASVLGKEFINANLAAKTGTTNDLRDSWFAGIDGKEVVVIWIGRDHNESTKLYGATGALTLYSHYLKIRTALPLRLFLPDEISMINITLNGNFCCDIRDKWINIPIWKTNNSSLNYLN